jgi:hexosaminidase
MAFPRACAIAEVVWTPRELRDYDDFMKRLPEHLERLKTLGVNYRPLD